MDTLLKGRHVVVTGASGSLGAEVARLAWQQGAVCHLPVRGSAPEGLLPHSDHVRWVEHVDVSDEDAVRRLYAGLPELWASVHCVGAWRGGPLAETRLEDLSMLLALNFTSAFLCSRAALAVMRRGGRGGRLVHVVARPALEPRTGAGQCAYAASKGALTAFTVALAEELADEGVLVNAVAPSVLARPDDGAPVGLPTPRDVAQAILALASPANVAVQGALLPVYGRHHPAASAGVATAAT